MKKKIKLLLPNSTIFKFRKREEIPEKKFVISRKFGLLILCSLSVSSHFESFESKVGVLVCASEPDSSL